MTHDFASATQATLHFLREQFGFDMWMVTRTEGNDWIVLAVEDAHYGIQPGSVFPWEDSFCSRMVKGLGPRIAPQANLVDAYASAPIARQLQIGAYVGVPITRGDGSLFGTLCAIDPEPQSDHIREGQATIELLADLLSSLLHAELSIADITRRAERAESEAARDGLTALYNRRCWDRLLAREEERCRRYGNPACVLSIDLDDLKVINDTQGHAAGDKLLTSAADAIRAVVRGNDIVARLGGDEFAILGIECNPDDAAALVRRLQESFDAAGVRASIGCANRHPVTGLQAAAEEADAAMYAEKKRRRQAATA